MKMFFAYFPFYSLLFLIGDFVVNAEYKRFFLGDIANISSGGTPSRSNPAYWNGNIPWIKTTQIQNCFINKTDVDEWITDEGLKKSSAKMISAGTILMAMYGQGKTRGQVSILNFDASINQACAAIELNKGVCRDFIYQSLLSMYTHIRNMSNTGGQDNLSVGLIKEIPITLPPLPEQKAIADLLSTWDEAIEKTERLIQAKEKQFKWLLRELISEPAHKKGNTEWKKVKLGEICKVTTGQSAPQDLSVFTDSGFPFIRVSSLDLLLGKSDSKQTEYITKAKGNELKMILFKPGTILFAKSGISALQKRVCKLKESAFIVSHLCALIPKNNIHEDFLMYYLMKHHPNRLIQGDGFPSIKTSEVSSLKMTLPPLEKQKKIAKTLSSAQHEIDLLKQLTEKYKTQKRGLMQKMLTGQWRVKPEIVNQYEEK